MPGTPVECRSATTSDLPALMSLIQAAADEQATGQERLSALSGVAFRGRSIDTSTAHARVAVLLGDRTSRIYVALCGDRVVGAMATRAVLSTTATQGRFIEVESLYVLAEQRRRGFGHALLARALDDAESVRAEHIVCAPGLVSRSLQRFLVRLGFASSARARIVPVAILRRRIVPGEGTSRRPRATEDVLARRRRESREARDATEAHSGEQTLREALSRHGRASRNAPGYGLSAQVNRAVATRRSA